ncbi:MAG: prepilin-type N-terminal cleavage/methylation domain-containing protein [Oscillospiraceae bacterium]|nr:prepilin-type N-terminal cleavage/methylation domain-containing protein [Oscillospiraceae bacterium]
MKKRFKGFTLIECLVALAVLGVSSMLLVQAYSQLMKMTNLNHAVYTSIADQMADVEKSSTGHAKELSPALDKSHKYSSSEGRTLKIERAVRTVNATTGEVTYSKDNTNKREYITNVSVYASNAYVNHDIQSAEERNKQGTDVRYIYFHR